MILPKDVKVFVFSFFKLVLILFLGQSSAITLGESLAPVESDAEGLKSEVDDGAMNLDTAVTLAHFKDAGFLYTEEGESNWVIFIARNINSSVKVTEVKGDGIILTWNATPPSDASIIAVQKITGMDAGAMNVQRSSCSLFVPSPRSLSKDSSKINKGTTLVPPATAEWLVLSIPFEDTEEDLGIEIEPLKPNG